MSCPQSRSFPRRRVLVEPQSRPPCRTTAAAVAAVHVDSVFFGSLHACDAFASRAQTPRITDFSSGFILDDAKSIISRHHIASSSLGLPLHPWASRIGFLINLFTVSIGLINSCIDKFFRIHKLTSIFMPPGKWFWKRMRTRFHFTVAVPPIIIICTIHPFSNH